MLILFLCLLLLLVLGYTIYLLTNHQALYAEADYLARTVPMSELQAEDDALGWQIWIFFTGGAALTGAFAVQFFSGADNPMDYTPEQWVYAVIGIICTLAITYAQKSLYSSIQGTKAGLFITALILLFVIFSEIATSGERTDLLTKHRSTESAVFKSTVNAIQAPASISAIDTTALANAQADKADAVFELGRCDRHASAGAKRVERCEVYEQKRIEQANARIAALQTAGEMQLSANHHAKLELIETAKALQYDEQQAPMITRFLQSLFSGPLLYAMILASLIFVVAFESGFHFQGTRRAVLRHAMRLKLRFEHEEPASGTETDTDALPADAAPAQTLSSAQRQANREAWRKAFEERGLPHDDDPALWGDASASTISNILGKLPDTEGNKGSQETDALPAEVRELSQKRFFQMLYTAIRQQIINGTLRPTLRPVTNAVTEVIKHKADKLGIQPSLMGKPQRQTIAETILMKLELEQIVERNQDGGIGKPKYRLAQRYAARLRPTPDTLSTTPDSLADKGQQGTEGTTPNKVAALIGEGIAAGDIKRVSVSDKGQCQQMLRHHGVGKSNPERRSLLEQAFQILKAQKVLSLNPAYTNSQCGKDKWVIA